MRAGAHIGRPRVDGAPHSLRTGARPAQEERGACAEQESNAALETYQRQVRTLEEHFASSDGWYVAFSSLLSYYLFLCREEQVEKLLAEKLALEQRAAEQAQTLRELMSTNVAPSARAAARTGCRGGAGGAAHGQLGIGEGADAEAGAFGGDQPRPDGKWRLEAAAARPWKVIATN